MLTYNRLDLRTLGCVQKSPWTLAWLPLKILFAIDLMATTTQI
jgi:hypothetical protein